jgi:hypothetical protein
MAVLKQFDKFRHFDFGKRNVGYNNIVDQQVDPFLIIENLLVVT